MESIDERTTHMLGDDEPGGINVRFMGRGIWSLACRVTANTMLRTMRGDQFFPQYGILSGIGLSILACAGLGADPVASQTQPIAKSALQGKHPVNAEDWSQFRGPNGQGVARAQSFPVELDLQRQLVWKVSVPPATLRPSFSGTECSFSPQTTGENCKPPASIQRTVPFDGPEPRRQRDWSPRFHPEDWQRPRRSPMDPASTRISDPSG